MGHTPLADTRGASPRPLSVNFLSTFRQLSVNFLSTLVQGCVCVDCTYLCISLCHHDLRRANRCNRGLISHIYPSRLRNIHDAAVSVTRPISASGQSCGSR